MSRFTAMVALFLLVCGVASAAETKKTVKAAPKEEVLKLSADQVFNFVEQVVKDPKADRVQAKKFLKAAMNGQVRMLQTATELGTVSTMCISGTSKCPNGCASCNISTFKCHCSLCCIAATQ